MSFEPWSRDLTFFNHTVGAWLHQSGSNPTSHYTVNFESWLYNVTSVLALGFKLVSSEEGGAICPPPSGSFSDSRSSGPLGLPIYNELSDSAGTHFMRPCKIARL